MGTFGVVVTRKEMSTKKKKDFKMHQKVKRHLMNAITFKEFDKIPNKDNVKVFMDTFLLCQQTSKIVENKCNVYEI